MSKLVERVVPKLRISSVRDQEAKPNGDFVLYWMTANRRTRCNFSLQRAVDWARTLKKPLVVLEALRCDYRWASDRLHQFVIQGMTDNAASLKRKPVYYYPYLEPASGAGKGLLQALAEHSCVVLSDDFPCFFFPKMMRSAARQVRVRFEIVDSNGILPMRAAGKAFARAFDFRRFLQKNLRPHLAELPESDPLRGITLPRLKEFPPTILQRWPAAHLGTSPVDLSGFPIDRQVPVVDTVGGSQAAGRQRANFLGHRIARYNRERNQPRQEITSGLSPYLHFGHISAHEIFAEVMQLEEWSPGRLAAQADGRANGWWGASENAEAFLDQLIIWRELGFNMCCHRDDYNRYESLPAWAQKTLAEHTDDPREHLYSFSQFEQAQTHDPLWNAAQRQLLLEGRIHNYLRMLWGKKILEWSASPRDALDVMLELNNKYALDGRDPNSYSGIFWVLGRYDRAWGPERPVYGKVRYMSSRNTARKVRVREYLEAYGN